MSEPMINESETRGGSCAPATGLAQAAFICALRCVTDAAIHNTLMPRREMGRILREEAQIIEDNREHFAAPNDQAHPTAAKATVDGTKNL